MSDNNNQARPAGTHIVVLLDRSGSMSSIATDVIGGFNTFLQDQRSNGSDARMSVVLFDSQDPQETVVWGAPFPRPFRSPSAPSCPGRALPFLMRPV